ALDDRLQELAGRPLDGLGLRLAALGLAVAEARGAGDRGEAADRLRLERVALLGGQVVAVAERLLDEDLVLRERAQHVGQPLVRELRDGAALARVEAAHDLLELPGREAAAPVG